MSEFHMLNIHVFKSYNVHTVQTFAASFRNLITYIRISATCVLVSQLSNATFIVAASHDIASVICGM